MVRRFRFAGWPAMTLAVGALAMVLASCANPATGSTTSGGTISGRVYNPVTGAGLSGAQLSIGSYNTTTDSSGDYSVTLNSGATPVSGIAASDGADYQFIYAPGVSVPTSGGSATLNVPLSPVSKPTIVGTVSGTVKYQDGTAVPTNTTNTISLTIINENGGSYSPAVTTTSSNGVTSYSASTPTVGTSCFVVVSLPSSTGEAAETYYLKNISIGSSTTLNLQPPAAASSVNVTGSAGTSSTTADVAAVADVPGYGFTTIASTTLSSSTGTISVYDPDGYKLQWGQLIPPTGSTLALKAGWAASESFNPASTVSLPALSQPEPASGPSLSGATYSKANGTLQGFTPVSGISGTLLAFVNPSTNQATGAVWVTGSSVTFPSSIQTLIDAQTSWTLQGASVNMSATSATVPETLTLLSSGGLLLYSPSANVDAGITLSNSSKTISS